MTNIEQYINNNSCVTLPKRVSKYLQEDNFLSEFKTDELKELAMLNLLLLDNVPTEGSTKLINSGDIYNAVLSIKQYTDNKVISYDNLTNKPTKLSLFINDIGYLTLHLSLDNYYDKATINDIIDHLDISDELVNYYTKSEINDVIIGVLNNNYYNKSSIDTLLGNKVNITDLKTVATTGNYNDLINKPTKISDLINDSLFLTEHQSLDNYYNKTEVDNLIGNIETIDSDDYYNKTEVDNKLSTKVNIVSLANVALSGSYSDLSGTPSFKTINNESILGEGNITVNSLEQIQADWNQTDNTAKDFIKNKPDLSTYATQSYVDDAISNITGLSIRKLTQDLYNALQTKDPNVLYIITT